jgi:hypothetical protein
MANVNQRDAIGTIDLDDEEEELGPEGLIEKEDRGDDLGGSLWDEEADDEDLDDDDVVVVEVDQDTLRDDENS